MILYFETMEIQLRDIPRVLSEMGYAVQSFNLQIQGQEFCRDTCDKVLQVLKKEKVDYVITYNFIETVSQACLEADVPYIAWVYDNPQQELYTKRALYPNNYIFVFDKKQQKRLRQIGIKNVYHMPLAIDGMKVLGAIQEMEDGVGQYEAELAFVGQLYKIESLENIIKRADAEVQSALEDNMRELFLNWNSQLQLHGSMQDSCVQYFNQIEGYKVAGQFPYVTDQYYYEAAVLSRVLANRERVTILNTLAKSRDVRFYTFDQNITGLDERVQLCPGAKYDTEVANVYRQSKINLNITLHCIETGLSQRIFDVMAAGGFLLSNYQEELEELFVPGEDLVIYHNMEELLTYVDYYLKHEEERQRIAKNGQAKVLKYHDFRKRLTEVLEIVDRQEAKRNASYQELLQTNEAEMEFRKDLVRCYNLELRLGSEKLFADMENNGDVVKRYFEPWKKLLELEETATPEQYADLCQLIKEGDISRLFIAWLIYNRKTTEESVLLRLCTAMKQYSMLYVMELLSYALLMTSNADVLLVKRAECFMELSMWKEALDTLKAIQEPQEAVLGLIRALEKVIQR